MATLQKFKLLATQCAVVAGSPTRSPTASPVIHLRRRKTLRMFLSRPDRRRFARREDSAQIHEVDPPEMSDKEVRVRRKLKDLFVSSPPPTDDDKRCQEEERREQEGLLPAMARFRTSSAFRRGGAASLRPISSAFRYRFLKRAWRPVLVTIPE